MRSEKELLEKRANIVEQVKDKFSELRTAGREPNADENTFFDKADADILALTGQIDEVRKNGERENRVAGYESMLGEQATQKEVRSVQTAAQKSPEFRKVLAKWMAGGEGAVSADERSVLGAIEQRGTSTLISSTAGLGGYTMPEEWAKDLYKTMLWYGGALEACGISYHSSGGGDLHLPKVDDSTAVGAIIGQGVADVVLDTAFTEVILGSFSYTSKIIKVGYELIEDSAYDIVSEVQQIAAQRVGRKLNLDFTTGVGSTTSPLGIFTASTLGKTAASATVVTRNEIVDLIHSVDPGHRQGPKVGFMFNDAKLAAIKKLAFGTGDDRPLWQMSIREGEPDRLEGFKYWINNDAPASTTGLKSMVFGNFDAYKIRQIGGYVLARSNERYFEERAAAFFVFARFDGDLINTAAIKHLIQA
jgi:HK97 family phage major capsid protein